ncbi:MAG: TolB family protein [Kordiimonas sp.]
MTASYFKTILVASTCTLMSTNALTAQAVASNKEEQIIESHFDFNFSPDGQNMIYYAYKGKKLPDIYKKPHHGSEINLTSSSETWDIEPDYSPDGSKILYSSGDSMAVMNLHIMNADGGDSRLLIDLEDSIVGPTWSPDGKKIAFSTFKMGSENPEGDVFIANHDGTHVKNLTDDISGSAVKPTWSKDGTHLYFAHSETKDGPADIYRMTSEGTDITRLTDLSAIELKVFDVQLTPDSSTLVFAATDSEGWTDIYAIPANAKKPATKPHQITKTEEASEYFLSFTPNGHHLTYSVGDWENGFSFAHIPTPKGHH